jgi:NTP pyrophosphatase (non-canonical NTP hydrolase)
MTKNKEYKRQHDALDAVRELKKLHIHEFQEMMRRIYFPRDSERGTTGTYKWLVEEVEELGAALKEQDRKALQNEFADVFAWLASLANVVDIDLETATTSKYNGKCPKCHKLPCECPVSKSN